MFRFPPRVRQNIDHRKKVPTITVSLRNRRRDDSRTSYYRFSANEIAELARTDAEAPITKREHNKPLPASLELSATVQQDLLVRLRAMCFLNSYWKSLRAKPTKGIWHTLGKCRLPRDLSDEQRKSRLYRAFTAINIRQIANTSPREFFFTGCLLRLGYYHDYFLFIK